MNQLRQIRMPDKMEIRELEGSCAGKAGRARLHYGSDPQLSGALATSWMEVGPRTDFTHQFALKDLRPGSSYYYALETSGPAGGEQARRRGTISHGPRSQRLASPQILCPQLSGLRLP